MANKFSDFGIKPAIKMLIGEKIKMAKILNRPIVVEDFRIEDSNKKVGTKCLYLQIEVDGQKHVLFTGSNLLMAMIQQVPTTKFPFTTTIVEENGRNEFR